jgi:hypothetical protein
MEIAQYELIGDAQVFEAYEIALKWTVRQFPAVHVSTGLQQG